jgi:ribonuclease E
LRRRLRSPWATLGARWSISKMAKTMLIDATHPEETRVAVVDRKLEEFDVEIAGRHPLKGNIYLAKVTRVEPSLQACFVEYGGNRHGFLAFSEIHPDYYRIPIADREALMRETQAALDSDHDHHGDHHGGHHEHHEPEQPDHDHEGGEHTEDAGGDPAHDSDSGALAEDAVAGIAPADPIQATAEDLDRQAQAPDLEPEHQGSMPLAAHQDVLRGDILATNPNAGFGADPAVVPENGDAELPAPAQAELVEVTAPEEVVDTVGEVEPASQDDPEVDEENARRRRQRALRRYKIQEVIKRRQILLVQVTKEERGNKGAALTTYLSLAGRYCVLMPNTDRGGGISRRITSLNDRKRLKNIVDDLDVPEGMAVIVRTAGSERSKAEVKRDFEYLMRLWDEIRETTLNATAPALIYEEASLIKRSIRDLYTREMGDIVVAGVEGYKQAKSFMRMLTPSHAKRVQLYRDASIPLFQRYQVESQLAAIHNPTVHLRSGGYIVINQTEALVAVDVNSGRATKERNIEETATKTNLEAAEEIARQLRLRDLAGLIVIDFIDMEEGRNNSAVERRMKDALRNDRARIQIGRISSFGLLEMSRQRLHPSLQEASTEVCPHCHGSGRIRSVDSTALHVLRMVEEEITKTFSPGVSVFAPTAVSLYILNQKRLSLSQLEMRRGVRIYVNGDDSLVPPDYRLERIKQLAPGEELPPTNPVAILPTEAEIDIEDDIVEEAEEETEAEGTAEAETGPEGEAAPQANAEDKQGGRRRRRRRRGRGNRFSADEFTETGEAAPNGEMPANDDRIAAAPENSADTDDSEETETESADGENEDGENAAASEDGDPTRRRRRRGRRGGRRRSRRNQEQGDQETGDQEHGDQEHGDWHSEKGEAERAPDTGLAAGSGEQPAMPEDSEALPPQWRQPSGPAYENAPYPHADRGLTEDRPQVSLAAESPEAAGNSENPPVAPSSKPVTMVEIGGQGGGTEESASDDGAGDPARRRGWWRRLIE